MNERERLIELLNRYFTIGDSYAYNLTRVKEAFAIGTVDIDDFVEFDEEITADIADYLLENGVIVPPCKVGDKFYYLGQYAVNGEIKNNFKVFEKVVYSIEEFENDLIIYDERGISYGADCIFSTKEEAEEKLKEWNEKDEV